MSSDFFVGFSSYFLDNKDFLLQLLGLLPPLVGPYSVPLIPKTIRPLRLVQGGTCQNSVSRKCCVHGFSLSFVLHFSVCGVKLKHISM